MKDGAITNHAFRPICLSKTPFQRTGSRLTDLSQFPVQGDPPVVVFAEQGMGDFYSIFPLSVFARGDENTFLSSSRGQFLRLFKEWSPFSNRIVEERTTDPSKDLRPHIPLMSLPLVFGTELDTVPAAVPFLKPNQPCPDHLRFEIPPGGLSVGLVWASNPDNKAMYKNKSFPLSVLMPCLLQLIDLDLIHLHSLQFGDDADQLDPWSSHEGITVWKDRLRIFRNSSCNSTARSCDKC